GTVASRCRRGRHAARSAARISRVLLKSGRSHHMAFSGTGKVWMNGEIVDWANAKIHIATHVIHYGSAVFEGARCYKTPTGSAFSRLDAHMRRLFDSARIYRMDSPYDQATLTDAVVKTVQANGLDACYIRPLVYRGYHTLGVNPLPCPVDCAI